MANRKPRMCRLCLSTNAILRSIFTIFRNHNLVFIIRDYVRLEIEEDDNLPKMVCKSCAVKLIRVRENVSLFLDSDRKLRGIGTSAEEPEQTRMRKYTRRQDTVDVETEDSLLKKEVEDMDVKQEALPSDSEEDLPLGVLKSLVHKEATEVQAVEKVEMVEYLEESFLDHTADEPSPLCSAGVSEDECYKPEETINEVEEGSKRSTRTRKKPVKLQIASDLDTDDEDRDIKIKVEQSDSEIEPPEKVVKKRGRPKGRPRVKPRETNKTPKRRAVEKKPTSPVPTLHDFKCYICKSDSLGSQQALIEHFATHVDKVPYTCTECVMETTVLTRVRTLNSHMKMHAQPVKCDYCDRRYSSAAGKYYHTQTFHLGGGAPCLVNCKVCGKQCGSQAALKNHMKYHTNKLKCGHCDMVFNHPNKRRNHERTHDQNRGIQCVMCKKVLQSIESYDVHLKKHSQERSYQCHLCPKKFNTSCNLILHLKVHAKNDNYKPAKSWVDHYTILSRDPMHYKCNHCDRYNTDKVNNMISHLQAHFKEYECDQCQHKFATAKQLRAHYTTHTGEKPEKCKYCDKVFSTKNNLRIHLKASHPEWTPRQQQQQQQTEGTGQAGGSSFATMSVIAPEMETGVEQAQGVPVNVLRS